MHSHNDKKMIAITLTQKQIDDLNELLVQIKTIQAVNNFKVFNQEVLFNLEHKIIESLNRQEDYITPNQEQLKQFFNAGKKYGMDIEFSIENGRDVTALNFDEFFKKTFK